MAAATTPWTDLHDTVAVVTGAGGAIGQAITKGLLDEGVHVVMADIDEEALARVAGGVGSPEGVSPVQGDVSIEDDVARFGQVAEATGKRLSSWVNNAGTNLVEPAEQTSPQVWDRVMAVNLRSVFMGSLEARRLMEPHGTGSIVNISSLAGYRTIGTRAAYGASKAAIEQFTRYAATEWGPEGIRVNAVAPGFIMTPMSFLFNATPEQLADAVAEVPMRRIGTVEDVANAVLALSSTKMGYVTGHVLRVDGGLSA